MDYGLLTKAFWIFCLIAVLGSAWYARRMRNQDVANKPKS